MHRRLRTLILAFVVTAIAASCAPVYVPAPPPPIRIVARPIRPGRQYVWVAGHWKWKGGGYIWVDGHWERAKLGRAWVDGHWTKTPRGHRWVPGHWR